MLALSSIAGIDSRKPKMRRRSSSGRLLIVVGTLGRGRRLCAEANNLDSNVGGEASMWSSSAARADRLNAKATPSRCAGLSVGERVAGSDAARGGRGGGPPKSSRRVQGFEPAGDLFVLVRGDKGSRLRGSCGDVGDSGAGPELLGAGEDE